MSTNVLFPFLMEPIAVGGGQPGEPVVIGGFIDADVQPSLVAALGADLVEAALATVALDASVTPSFTASIGESIVAEIGPDPLTAELNHG